MVLGTLLKTHTPPSLSPLDMAFDGQYFWLMAANKVYQCDRKFNQLSTFTPDPTEHHALAIIGGGIGFDGQHLLLTIVDPNYVAKYTRAGVLIQKGVDLTASLPFLYGVTFDGQYYWVTDWQTSVVVCIDPRTGLELKRFTTVTEPRGICFDGQYFWVVVAGATDAVIAYTRAGVEVARFAIPDGNLAPRVMGFDGQYLYTGGLNNDKILQVSRY